jgi:hypothetical protein
MVVSYLRPRGNRAETLGGSSGHGGSPRGLLWPWGGDEATWRDGMSSTVGGTMGFASRMVTFASAVQEPSSVLQRVDGLTYLGQKTGGVRFLGMLEVHS